MHLTEHRQTSATCSSWTVECSLNSTEQFARSILVTTSPTRATSRASDGAVQQRRTTRGSREDVDVSGDVPVLPFSLPHAYLIGRPAVCCGLYCCPFVRVSCRRSTDSTSPTRMTFCGHPHEDPRSILIRHVRHTRFPRVTC